MTVLDAATRAAQLLADPLRTGIVESLSREALTVSELAARLGAPQPRISSHLALLREAGWVTASQVGRQRRYALASPTITAAVESLADTAPVWDMGTVSAASPIRRRPRVPDRVREARTCYDHLAGVSGVRLCAALLERGWIEPVEDDRGKHQPGYALTDEGRRALAARGVVLDVGTSQRRFAYACPDWTEAVPHIGGALGAAILDRLEAIGVVEREPGTRAVRLTGDLDAWLA